MAYVPRLTCPQAGNKYYITKSSGGYSNAIKGSPTHSCNVLSNCVGYAYGRFNEIGGYGCCKYLSPVNAENFIQYKGNLETGMTPKLGACMVWQKGATLSGSDGAGHVAIVEQIISPTEVITSESGWNASKAFWTQTRKKGSDGRWGQGSDYKFLGFIYNPAPCCNEDPNDVLNKDTLDLIKMIDEHIDARILSYPDISDIPSYWKPSMQEFLDMDIINGGTSKEIDPNDINLTQDTVKALIIVKQYIDLTLKGYKKKK